MMIMIENDLNHSRIHGLDDENDREGINQCFPYVFTHSIKGVISSDSQCVLRKLMEERMDVGES